MFINDQYLRPPETSKHHVTGPPVVHLIFNHFKRTEKHLRHHTKKFKNIQKK